MNRVTGKQHRGVETRQTAGVQLSSVAHLQASQGKRVCGMPWKGEPSLHSLWEALSGVQRQTEGRGWPVA